jgi:hypothetical protein
MVSKGGSRIADVERSTGGFANRSGGGPTDGRYGDSAAAEKTAVNSMDRTDHLVIAGMNYRSS